MAKLPLIGMNYYHESMGYIARTAAQVNTDLEKISTLTKRIKIYHNPFENNDAVAEGICKQAKTQGFYVVWVENNDTTTLTAANWSTYSDAVVADALVAHNAGADEFLVGNELSIHNDNSADFNDTNLPAKVKTLATACATNFPRTKGFQEGWWKDSAWETAGLGSLSKLYFTLYENDADFKTNAQNIKNKTNIGTPVIGEFSTSSVMSTVAGTDEELWARQIAYRVKTLQDIGFNEAWPFTFREPSARGFGFMDEGDDVNFHVAWQSLFGGRRWFYGNPNTRV